jgi:hypothetical protein
MERMQASGESATAAVGAAADTEGDLLAEMMKAMQASDLEGEGGEEDFSKMLLGMMEQLTNKEILYEPMKELDDKFPDWLEKNGNKQTKEDLARYIEQKTYVREIVGRFEKKGYSDDNAKDREYIVERMQKVSFPVFAGEFGIMLILNRCKQLDHRLLIWLGICKQHKKHLEHPKRAVPRNEEIMGSNLLIQVI